MEVEPESLLDVDMLSEFESLAEIEVDVDTLSETDADSDSLVDSDTEGILDVPVVGS